MAYKFNAEVSFSPDSRFQVPQGATLPSPTVLSGELFWKSDILSLKLGSDDGSSWDTVLLSLLADNESISITQQNIGDDDGRLNIKVNTDSITVPGSGIASVLKTTVSGLSVGVDETSISADTAGGVLRVTPGAYNRRYLHHQTVASSSWLIEHNLNSTYPMVQCYDENEPAGVMIPDSVDVDGSGSPDTDNPNFITINFFTPVTGWAVITASGTGIFTGLNWFGTSGQVTYWNGSNSLTGDSSFLWNGSELSVKNTLKLLGATSGYVGLSSAAIAGSTTYTLPSADGSSGQILSTDGSGLLSWVPGGGTLTGTGVSTKIAFWTGTNSIDDAVDLIWDSGTSILTTKTILPTTDNLYDLGTSLLRWRDIYLGPGSINLGTDGNTSKISYDTSNNRMVLDPNGDGSIPFYLTDLGTLHTGELITNAKVDYEVSALTRSFEDFSIGATTVVLGYGELSSGITIPFTFNFYGLNYTSIHIASSGYITFNRDGYAAYASSQGNVSNFPNNFIAGYLVDLDPSLFPGTIQYKIFNSTPNQIFVVQFENVRDANDTVNNTFQIKLFETSNDVEIHVFESSGAVDETAFQGIQGPDIRNKNYPGRNSEVFSITPLDLDAVKFEYKSIGNITKNLSNNGISTKDLYVKNDFIVDGVSNFTDSVSISKLTNTNTNSSTLNVSNSVKIDSASYSLYSQAISSNLEILEGTLNPGSYGEFYGLKSSSSNKSSSSLTNIFVYGGTFSSSNDNPNGFLGGAYGLITDSRNYGSMDNLTGISSTAINYGSIFSGITGNRTEVVVQGSGNSAAVSGNIIAVNSFSPATISGTSQGLRVNNSNSSVITGNLDGFIGGINNYSGGSCATARGFESSVTNSAIVSGELNAGNIYVQHNSSGTATTSRALRVLNTNNGTVSGNLYGTTIGISNNKSVTDLFSIESTVEFTGTLGTVTGTSYSGKFITLHSGTATIPSSKGIEISILNNSTGIITEHRSLNIKQPSNTSGTITTNTGIYIESQNSGTITNNYAIKIDDQGSTYALYTGSGPIRLGDHISLNNTGTATELRFYEPSGSGSNYTAFKAQAQTGDVTLTLPSGYAAVTGYMLSSTDAGVLSWVAGGGGTIDGSGSANKLAIWSDSDTLTSDANLDYQSGKLTIGNTSGSATLHVENSGSVGIPHQITVFDSSTKHKKYMLKSLTTNATPLEMFLNSPINTLRMVISTDTTWGFKIWVTARRTNADNESAFYTFEGCIDNNAGTTALVGSVLKAIVTEDTATWDVNVTADNTNDALIITVTGVANITWLAVVDIFEVIG